MRETKITAFLLGATILSSMTLSSPVFATATNDMVDWVFELNDGTATSDTYYMKADGKNQVLQEGTTWEAGDAFPITVPDKTITVDGNTSSGQAISGETIKGTIAYNLESVTNSDEMGTLVVKNVGDMVANKDYSNIANVTGSNVAGYIQNLTNYLVADDTIKDSAGADLDVSANAAVWAMNTNLTVNNNVFYGSSTVGADEQGLKDYGAAILMRNSLDKTAQGSVSENIFIENKAQGNGGALNIDGNIDLSLTNNTFVQNQAVGVTGSDGELIGHGGAIDFSGDNLTSSGNRFYQNTANEMGGAIYIHKDSTVTSTNDQFIGNSSATQNGGAILNIGSLTVKNGDFQSNKATGTYGNGGAISNDFVVYNPTGENNASAGYGTLKVSATKFYDNEATNKGGAVSNNYQMESEGNTYDSNMADAGGAISNAAGDSKQADGTVYDSKEAVLKSTNDTFTYNHAGQIGGAVYSAGNVVMTSDGTRQVVKSNAQLTNVTMKDNTAGYRGGAIYNAGDMVIDGGTFDHNRTSDATDGGGAINNDVLGVTETSGGSVVGLAVGNLEMSGAVLKNNSSQNSGGAIQNAGTLTSSGNTYLANSSKAGGAITNETSSIQNVSSGVVIPTGTLTSTNDTFKSNTATDKGGAIYNIADATIEGATFEGNESAQGGAIYNSGNLTIQNAASTTFKGNTASTGGSAIYNETGGTVTIQGAKDTIDLDYDPYYDQSTTSSGHPSPSQKVRLFADNEDVVNKGTLNIKDSSLQLHHSSDLTKGVINIDKSKTGTVNVDNSRIDVGKSKLYGDTININEDSELLTHVSTKNPTEFGGLQANTINVSDDNTAITIRVKAGEHMSKEDGPREFKILDASTLNVVDNTGFATITKNHMYDIKYKGDGVYELTKIRPICPNGGCVHNAWVESEQEMTEHKKAQQIRELLNDLAQKYGCESKLYRDALDGIAPDVSPLIQAQATEITQRLHGIISKQMYASMDRTGYVHRGKRFYRFPERKSHMWVQGIYGQSEYSGDKGFDMDTEGLAIGFDKQVGRDTKLGLAYSYTKSDGTAVQRDTDVESHTIALYGEYNPDRFYTNWLALYTRSSYEEDKKVYTERVKAEYDVDVFGGQIMFGNKMGPFVVGDWASGVLSPEIGLRYAYIKQHGYTDSAGQKVNGADGHNLTGILGAQYTIGYTLSPSIAWYPELRAAITYDFLEPDLENSVTLVNGARYDVVTENLDKFGIEIGARVGLDINRKAEIALEYEGVFRGDYTNHTGLASLKYKF